MTYRKSKTKLVDCTFASFGKNLVNFDPLTKKLEARMLTRPKLTMRILRNDAAFKFGRRDFATGGILSF